MASDGLRDAGTEDALSDDAVPDEGHVEDDVDHVGLLAVVLLVVIVVDDQVLPIGRVHADVGKVLDVGGVCEKSVPMDALDRLLGDLGMPFFSNQPCANQNELDERN